MCAPQTIRQDLTPFEIASEWDIFKSLAIMITVVVMPLIVALRAYTPSANETEAATVRTLAEVARLGADFDCEGTGGVTCTPAQQSAALHSKKQRELRRVRARIEGPERSLSLTPTQARGGLADVLDSLLEAPLERRCAQEHAAGRPVQGWMKMLAEVSAAGAVLSVHVEQSTIDNDAVGKCIERELAAARFAATGEPRTQRLTYAFSL